MMFGKDLIYYCKRCKTINGQHPQNIEDFQSILDNCRVITVNEKCHLCTTVEELKAKLRAMNVYKDVDALFEQNMTEVKHEHR